VSKHGSYLPRPFPHNGSVFERISRRTSFRDTRRETSLPLNDARLVTVNAERIRLLLIGLAPTPLLEVNPAARPRVSRR
jgi:hypothetical protein